MIKTGATFRLFNCHVRVLGRVGGDLPYRQRKYKVRTLENTTLRGMVICEGAEIFVSPDWVHRAARMAGIQTKTKYSKYDGVTWHKTQQRWYSFVYENGRRTHIGYFMDEDLAFKARQRYLARKPEVAA